MGTSRHFQTAQLRLSLSRHSPSLPMDSQSLPMHSQTGEGGRGFSARRAAHHSSRAAASLRLSCPLPPPHLDPAAPPPLHADHCSRVLPAGTRPRRVCSRQPRPTQVRTVVGYDHSLMGPAVLCRWMCLFICVRCHASQMQCDRPFSVWLKVAGDGGSDLPARYLCQGARLARLRGLRRRQARPHLSCPTWCTNMLTFDQTAFTFLVLYAEFLYGVHFSLN